jgi:transposase
MLTVDQFACIRRAFYQDKIGIREIAKTFGHSRRKVREILQLAEPKPYPQRQSPAPKLDPVKPFIDAILTSDQTAPRKQRHTAMQIYRRLAVEQRYEGGYDQVRRYVQTHRRRERETFIPLDHDPGQRAEADFGQIWVQFPDGRRQVPVLLVTWAWSYCPFTLALPTQRTEAILHGLVEAFTFFGCVPRELWWDNPTTVAVQILSGRQRKLNDRYQALASHYNFEPLFCMPARGNEKPHVENRVKDLERRWATPVPQANDLVDLNAYLLQRCRADFDRVATGRQETIGQRFAQERALALSLPAGPFDACVCQGVKVDKYQTAAFDNNRYSVPRSSAFRSVTAKGYVDQVVLVDRGQVVAQHRRCYDSGQQILDPRHFLTTLERKPGCLDHANVYRHWQLPAIFAWLRHRLEEEHGVRAGTRQFVRLLLLLERHPEERVASAIEECCFGDHVRVEAILERAQHLALRHVRETSSDMDMSPATDVSDIEMSHRGSALPPALSCLQVPMPDLRRFNALLSGDETHDYVDSVVAEDQFEAIAAADHGR